MLTRLTVYKTPKISVKTRINDSFLMFVYTLGIHDEHKSSLSLERLVRRRL